MQGTLATYHSSDDSRANAQQSFNTLRTGDESIIQKERVNYRTNQIHIYHETESRR